MSKHENEQAKAPLLGLLGLIVTVGLVINVFLDGLIVSYEGTQGTYVLGGLVGALFTGQASFSLFRRSDVPARSTERDQ